MLRKPIHLLTLLLLAGAPLAFAHDGHEDNGTGPVSPNTHCWRDQNPHDFIVGPPFILYDSNTQDEDDCNVQVHKNPSQYSSDGDREFALGGGFFPSGSWAGYPDCNNYVDHHHSSVHVHSEIPAEPKAFARFVIGADPTPPTVVTIPAEVIDPDGIPDNGDEIVVSESRTECVGDGCICPGEFDSDDWLQPCVHVCPIAVPPGNTNPYYGLPGGDGGYWVFLSCTTPCLSVMGHIWFPSNVPLGSAPGPVGYISIYKPPTPVGSEPVIVALPTGWKCERMVGGNGPWPANIGDPLPNSGDSVECTPPGNEACNTVLAVVHRAAVSDSKISVQADCAGGGPMVTAALNAPGDMQKSESASGKGSFPLRCTPTWTNGGLGDGWGAHCQANWV